jgi:hypothetical protein
VFRPRSKPETIKYISGQRLFILLCVGFEFLTAVVIKRTIFLDITPAFALVSCSTYSSTLKMEAICYSETSVDFRQTTRRYIPENSTLYDKMLSPCLKMALL